jgi:hypothetical protein
MKKIRSSAAKHAEETWKFASMDRSSKVDERVESFLAAYFMDIPGPQLELPKTSLILDRPGLARVLSLPRLGDEFSSEHVHSYRLKQGVLHNPLSDRRTTQGAFHITEGGLPIPDDKVSVPKETFRTLFRLATQPPAAHRRLPFTTADDRPVECFVSLLMHPVVCPAVPGFMPKKHMEVLFYAPGGLVSNLDFVESIFGNAGDPYATASDAALRPESWTGHTGCVILAPHLTKLTKKEVGLPRESAATARQRRDGMCWKDEKEFYNDGRAFKITCRDARGVIVTVIADNYFGYCKKEVKTQISYSANLFGFAEEEHAGGAVAFASYDLGDVFCDDGRYLANGASLENALETLGRTAAELRPEGYAVDSMYPGIFYVPKDALFNLAEERVSWTKADGSSISIGLLLGHTYVLPNGYKVHLEPPGRGTVWRLIGTLPEGTLCHKPCTVSGGGKSEISKSLFDAILEGPIYVHNLKTDLDTVEEIIAKDYASRYRDAARAAKPSRPILSLSRSLGSVIKLFTPSPDYTDAYNAWLETIPPHVKDLIFFLKRHHKTDWGMDWRSRFSVDLVDGHPGHELKYAGQRARTQFLRVGHDEDGSWRVYKLRQDFSAAGKVQVEDDITASVVVPRRMLKGLNPRFRHESVKLVTNCEQRLFQRPDDAIHRGRDRQAELDLTNPGAFLSNFEPMTTEDARVLMDDAIGFSRFTEPVRRLVEKFSSDSDTRFFASPAHPRLVDGKPSKNPRYLQDRPDLTNARGTYLAAVAARLFRRLPHGQPVPFPVNAILVGRRMNIPDRRHGIPPLAVYGPIHYQELPELFLDFITSVTGKSPSTTGFGSEGALTKGPFNALPPVIDLNNALVGFIVCGYAGFSSAAGYVGPHRRVDHDVSLLVPEIWCRMRPEEQEPDYLIANEYLERIENFTFEGRTIQAGMLGWRINERFVRDFLGRIFVNPHQVFDPGMLRPERADAALFAEAIDNLVTTQREVARRYFEDGSIRQACPPRKALLHVMKDGQYEGRALEDTELRRLFTRGHMMGSDWYRARLEAAQTVQTRLWEKHVKRLQSEATTGTASHALTERLKHAKKELALVHSPAYLEIITGTIGADPSIAL